MASRDEIVSFLDELLDSPGFPDYGPNGLQVPGAEQVELVVTGVSAHLELFERAAAAGAQLVLCHHGIVWGSRPQAISDQAKRRLQALFAADMSLAAYHLPLDAHPEIGNNALICAALGLEPTERIGAYDGRPIGFVGRSAEGIPLADLRARCIAAFGGREPLIQGAGPGLVHSLGVISGAAAASLDDAIALGLDGLLTGEPSEHSMADASENGLHFVAAGHYATETFGIRRLGEIVAERFGVEHRFIEVPNPV
ncbi:MAG TPA: Nif3-like dinuclear metal center hexameric protein [Thermoleophilaceae bacterium]|nr:Nif3-like dinuclear metal center hexameric protein [Thermoleophilaceae bacterium]